MHAGCFDHESERSAWYGMALRQQRDVRVTHGDTCRRSGRMTCFESIMLPERYSSSANFAFGYHEDARELLAKAKSELAALKVSS